MLDVSTGAWESSQQDPKNYEPLKSETVTHNNFQCKQSVNKIALFLVFLRLAKEKRLRIWKDYTPSAGAASSAQKTISGKVSLVISVTERKLKKKRFMYFDCLGRGDYQRRRYDDQDW